MPKLGIEETPFIKEARKKSSEWSIVSEAELLDLVKKYNPDLVGSGSESVVIKTPESTSDELSTVEQPLIAFQYRDYPPLEAKEIFYLQRIFSTLFPNNFPHFFAAFAKDPQGKNNISGTLRKEIKRGRIQEPILFPFANALKKAEELGIPVKRLEIDDFHGNFLVNNDGGEYYMDVTRSLNYSTYSSWDAEEIKKRMEEAGYSDKSTAIVISSINRLQELVKNRKENQSL